MATHFRIGVLGLTHDHIWSNLEDLAEASNGELVAVADVNEPLLEQARTKYGCAIYTDAKAMVASERLDAVYVFSDNATGAELATWAASRDLHVLIEKPMAATLQGAEAMLEAAERSGVRLMVNWPFAWWPQLRKAIALAMEGNLGTLWQVKYRAAHAGPEELGCSEYFCRWLFDEKLNGAGALMDYCCYGAVLARVLLGAPSHVTGVADRLCKQSIDVEDNAILILSYPGAMATAEGSWTQIGKLSSYLTTIYGTSATLLVEPRVGGRLLRATAECPEGEEVVVGVPDPRMANATAHFLWAVEKGAEVFPLCDPRVGRDAQEILEAGRTSAEMGKTVELPL